MYYFIYKIYKVIIHYENDNVVNDLITNHKPVLPVWKLGIFHKSVGIRNYYPNKDININLSYIVFPKIIDNKI